ncbi:MAG: hypothetical protein ACLQU1_35060 [Bryobacteraceae bacterium]
MGHFVTGVLELAAALRLRRHMAGEWRLAGRPGFDDLRDPADRLSAGGAVAWCCGGRTLFWLVLRRFGTFQECGARDNIAV